MKILKVSILTNHIRFLFYCGSTHMVSHNSWRNGMKEVYRDQHGLTLHGREKPESNRILFTQAF